MSTSVTLRDVAIEAGVSIKTASRVLNNFPFVADETRAHVLDVMERLGYIPNLAARSLRVGFDATVGVLVDSIGDPFFAELAAAIEDVLDPAGFRVLIASTHRDCDRERQLVTDMVQRRAAGIILAPSGPHCLDWLQRPDVNVVFVDRVGEREGATSVVVADEERSRAAVRHLIERGHKRIAVISDRLDVETTRLRHQGVKREMAERGVPIDARLIRSNCDQPPQATSATAELLALPDPPTAIMCTNARLTLGVVPALQELGRTDVALIGYGDFSMAASLRPAVTVINHSAAEVGRRTAEVMLARIKGDTSEAGQTVFVDAELIERGSGELPPCQ